jgi:hypothetical protein
MLEKSVAQANSFFMDHKLMLGVINVGGLMARSLFIVPLVYFDAYQCIVSVSTYSVIIKAYGIRALYHHKGY